jgi:hypothetical protein
MSDYDDLVDYVQAYYASSPQGEKYNGGCAKLLLIFALSAILFMLLQLL